MLVSADISQRGLCGKYISTMLSFPNCKINLGLNILRKRSDGYHDLETIFYPIAIRDALEILSVPPLDDIRTVSERYQNGESLSSPPPLPDKIAFSVTGLPVSGEVQDNLCLKAYHLLKKDFPELPPVRIHLHKAIPMGAGLGGGSSNGAFTLQLLNKKFNLGISKDKLAVYALQLGSDCPFFLHNQPCYATGRGEMLEDIALDLSHYSFLVVNPGIHINTGWAFSNIIPRDAKQSRLKEAIQQPISSWKTELTNDFEKPVFDLYPEIKSIRDTLYKEGALYAAMSGSGSTVFGIFPYLAENLATLQRQLPYTTFLIKTSTS